MLYTNQLEVENNYIYYTPLMTRILDGKLQYYLITNLLSLTVKALVWTRNSQGCISRVLIMVIQYFIEAVSLKFTVFIHHDNQKKMIPYPFPSDTKLSAVWEGGSHVDSLKNIPFHSGKHIIYEQNV